MSPNKNFIDKYENLIPTDGEMFLIPDFLSQSEASTIQHRLLSELAWEEESLVVFGKSVQVPRLVCWYGDPQAVYSYSGTVHHPSPWTSTLKSLKTRIENFSGHKFNSVLGNLYRNGGDSMGWHADKEKELGVNPFITSLSVGENRLFRLRHNQSKKTINLYLTHGSLLLMGGNIQHRWRHCVPKIPQLKKSRINLTFRNIKDLL